MQGFVDQTSRKRVLYKPDPVRTTFLHPSSRGFQCASAGLPAACSAVSQPAPGASGHLGQKRQVHSKQTGRQAQRRWSRCKATQDAPTPWNKPCLLFYKGL